MKLYGLKPLYANMKSKGLSSARFKYKVNHANFDVFFATSPEKFELLFGYIGDEPFSFIVEVKRGFIIEPFIRPEEKYWKLIEILKIDSSSTNRFRPYDFFKEFDLAIPAIATGHEPHEKAQYMRYAREVDESEKIYFYGWTRPVTGPTAKNLNKTLDCLGYDEFVFCKTHGVSSRWTDIPEDKRKYTHPSKNVNYF